MLRIQNIEKSYTSQSLFEGASLTMTPGERLGLVGRNGHGKSTLFRMILGEEDLDGGEILIPKNYRIGHLAQHLHFTQPTVLEEGCLGLQEDEEHDHYKVERILFGLGFSKADMDLPPSQFSGGFQIRLNLAKVLVSSPNLLLLDEPTNYLDIVSIRWITEFLRDWENELIIISHDREFMDSVTTHTALIHRGQIHKVEGNTAKIYAKIAQAEEIHEKTRLNEDKQRKHMEAFVARFRAQASKAAMVQSRVKMLEKMPAKDKLSQMAELDFAFHAAPFEAKTLMEATNVSFHFDPAVPLIHHFHLTIGAKDRIAIIGKNGKGKSTLLNLLAGELQPQTGTIKSHANMKLGYFGQTNISRLNTAHTIEQEIGEANPRLSRTQTRGICGAVMFSGETAEKRISVLSGGEKSRVMLGKILAMPANLLFLDEPTNHLDMQSIDALMDAIDEFPGAVVMVTHSEMLLRRMATKLVIFRRGHVEAFNDTYDDFLEKIGWEEDEDGEPAKELPRIELPKEPFKNENRKEARRKRSELLAEKSKILTPLKKEITSLEEEICKLEKELASINEQLVQASQTKVIDQFIVLSKTVKELQQKIDTRFDQLATATQKHDEKSKAFEELLTEAG